MFSQIHSKQKQKKTLQFLKTKVRQIPLCNMKEMFSSVFACSASEYNFCKRHSINEDDEIIEKIEKTIAAQHLQCALSSRKSKRRSKVVATSEDAQTTTARVVIGTQQQSAAQTDSDMINASPVSPFSEKQQFQTSAIMTSFDVSSSSLVQHSGEGESSGLQQRNASSSCLHIASNTYSPMANDTLIVVNESTSAEWEGCVIVEPKLCAISKREENTLSEAACFEESTRQLAPDHTMSLILSDFSASINITRERIVKLRKKRRPLWAENLYASKELRLSKKCILSAEAEQKAAAAEEDFETADKLTPAIIKFRAEKTMYENKIVRVEVSLDNIDAERGALIQHITECIQTVKKNLLSLRIRLASNEASLKDYIMARKALASMKQNNEEKYHPCSPQSSETSSGEKSEEPLSSIATHEEIILRLGVELAFADKLESLIVKEVDAVRDISCFNSISDEVLDTRADLLEYDAAAEEWKLKLAAAQFDLDNMLSELKISERRIPVMEEAKRESVLTRSFKDAARIHKELNRMIARNECLHDEIDDTTGGISQIKKALDSLFQTIKKTSEMVNCKEREEGVHYMVLLVKKISELDEIRVAHFAVDSQMPSECGDEIVVRAIGSHMLEDEIVSLMKEGTKLDMKFRSWKEISSPIRNLPEYSSATTTTEQVMEHEHAHTFESLDDNSSLDYSLDENAYLEENWFGAKDADVHDAHVLVEERKENEHVESSPQQLLISNKSEIKETEHIKDDVFLSNFSQLDPEFKSLDNSRENMRSSFKLLRERLKEKQPMFDNETETHVNILPKPSQEEG